VISSTMPIERLEAHFSVPVPCAVTSPGAEEVCEVSERQGRSTGSGSLTVDDRRLQLPMAAPLGLGIGVEQRGRQPDRDALEQVPDDRQAPTATAGSAADDWERADAAA